MLEPLPSRSVARYLLPMTDIMAVLFSFFLLLPHLEQPAGRASTLSPEARRAGSLWSNEEQEQAHEELERLRRLARQPAHQRLFLVVLDIDGENGDLLFNEGGQTQRIARQPEVDTMVQQHLAAARAGGRELYYILRASRPQFQIHPDYADEARYRQWFAKWKVPFEMPGRRSLTPLAPPVGKE